MHRRYFLALAFFTYSLALQLHAQDVPYGTMMLQGITSNCLMPGFTTSVMARADARW
jgi:hypothetical protein